MRNQPRRVAPSAFRQGMTSVLLTTSVLWLASCIHSSQIGDELSRQFALAGPEAALSLLWLDDAETMPDIEEMLCEVSHDNIRRIVDELASFGTRHTLSETESETRGIGAARRFILSEFETYAEQCGRTGTDQMRVYFDRYTIDPDGRRIPRETEIVNVIGELPGATAEARNRRYYVIGHYDSRASNANDADSDAPGANDDASGVALLLELARVMSRRRFDATIVFLATAGEEQGLYGASMHARKAKSFGWDVRGVFNNDTVGDPSDPLQPGCPASLLVRVFSTAMPLDAEDSQIARIRSLGAEIDSPSRQLARYMFETAGLYSDWAFPEAECLDRDSRSRPAMTIPKMVYRTDRFLRGGDHTAFNQQGFPAVRLTEVAEKYNRQHQNIRLEDDVQYGDLPEYVDEFYIAAVARLNLATVARISRAPREPENARIIVARLENETTIRWEESPDRDVAGYEVVYRNTTSPYWQESFDAGNATEITIPVNKDNFFFGVRVYDREGYRSPVTFAGAARQ